MEWVSKKSEWISKAVDVKWVNERVNVFPAIEGILQQSMLYCRGCYYASSEIVQKLHIQK